MAERRLCSVLFCDVVGFTPLSEARDPEAVRELLSRYFEVARTVIGRYGGSVEKFIGDAVMAVWGTPTATEDDAERDLARARLAASGGDPAAESFAAAVSGLREQSTPYHLAQGLLDQAEYLARRGDGDAAALAIEEARTIGHRLRCQPLLDRADAIEGAASQIRLSR